MKKKTAAANHPRLARSKERKEREVDQRRKEIMAAALRALARHGPTSATMQQIASEAGYAPAALYTYFPSRDAIVEAIFDSMACELTGLFSHTPPADLPFPRRLESFLQLLLTQADSQREAHSVMMALAMANALPARVRNQAMDPETGTGFMQQGRLLTAWLERHATPSELGGRVPEDVAFTLMGISLSHFVRWMAARPTSRLADKAPEIVHMLLYGITPRSR